jgi:hypothetical protein
MPVEATVTVFVAGYAILAVFASLLDESGAFRR